MMLVTTIIRVTLYGGVVVLAASVWAWALGFAVWHGAVVGAILGLAAGIFLDGNDEGALGATGPVLQGRPDTGARVRRVDADHIPYRRGGRDIPVGAVSGASIRRE